MTKQTMEKNPTVENITEEKMAETIKTARREAESFEKKDHLSLSEILKDNTSEVIQKLESQIPTYMDLYSGLYTKYLHMLDDFFTTCYATESSFFERIKLDKTAVGSFDSYIRSLANMTQLQIEQTTNFAKLYVQFRLSYLDSYDKMVHLMMEPYSRAWDSFNNKK